MQTKARLTFLTFWFIFVLNDNSGADVVKDYQWKCKLVEALWG